MRNRIPLTILFIGFFLLVLWALSPVARNYGSSFGKMQRPEVTKSWTQLNREDLIRDVRKRRKMVNVDEEVINMYCDGKSIADISEELSISQHRVRQAFARKGPIHEWKD